MTFFGGIIFLDNQAIISHNLSAFVSKLRAKKGTMSSVLKTIQSPSRINPPTTRQY